MSAAPPGERVGAVVVGGDYQGLGIVRSLGRRRIPVFVVDDEASISRFSRFTTKFISTPSLRKDQETVDTLLRIGDRYGLHGWVLYPTRDETVAAFARHRESLQEVFRVPTAEWEKVKWAWDKRNTYRLATELGIPAPHTWYVQSVEELDQITTDPPYAIKPAIKEHFFYATKAKAWRANDRAELKSLFLRAKEIVGPGEVLVQDLIPGNGTHQFAYCAFFKDKKAVGSMVVRRRRQHPPEFGRASTFVETIDLPVLEEMSERFLRAIDYYGLVELEFKLDPRDGQYRLLDFNGRTWGYHSLGYSAGVDFSYMQFADQLGRQVDSCRGRSGVRWIRIMTDLPTGILEILKGREDWRLYFQSLRDAHVESVFSGEDPVTGVAEIALFPYLCIKRAF